MKTTCSKIVGYWHYGVILTYLSVIAAIVGMFLSVLINPFWGVVCLFVSGICDAFDGAVAKSRKNRTEEEKMFGSHIDSLSDIMAFGIAPVFIGFTMGLHEWYYLAIFCLFTLCALIRLAYFDVTEEIRIKTDAGRRTSFEGLPVTNVAIGVPVFYVVSTMFVYICPLAMELIMAFCYLLCAALFVIRFRMPKAGVRGLCITIAIVTVLVISLCLIRYYVCHVPLIIS
ncbi:MAG: CDP-alcohol phosphatidyltransferase family protein [Clostridiales bacterium]|nr:CDP-alcohol phosphatidyltransferase family protein [Clostridiales bacterium]